MIQLIATALVVVMAIKIVLNAHKTIPINAYSVLRVITFQNSLWNTLTINLFAFPNANLVITQTPKMNALNALHIAKNAPPKQCVFLATKYLCQPLLLRARVHLSLITLIMLA